MGIITRDYLDDGTRCASVFVANNVPENISVLYSNSGYYRGQVEVGLLVLKTETGETFYSVTWGLPSAIFDTGTSESKCLSAVFAVPNKGKGCPEIVVTGNINIVTGEITVVGKVPRESGLSFIGAVLLIRSSNSK